jgi:hypothetical protein
MRITRSTTTPALVAALPIELANYFVIGYPAGAHLIVPAKWFAAVAAQWYVLHLPGLFALNRFAFLRNHVVLGSTVMLLSGYLDTALLLAVLIWPLQAALRCFNSLLWPPKAEH